MLRILLFVLLAAPAVTGAQTTVMSLQGHLGTNLPVIRGTIGSLYSSDGSATAPGVTAGLEFNLLFIPDFSLGIGIDYLYHRGEIRNFRNEMHSFFRNSEQIGSIPLRENFIRLRLETQFHVQRVEMAIGLQLTQNVGSRDLTFNYTQITTRFTDRPSETVIELAEPIRTPGSTMLVNEQTTYAGLILGLGYQINDKFQIKARYDFGIHAKIFAEKIRIGRHTLDLIAACTLAGSRK